MAGTQQSNVARVTSKDGTNIGYFTSGQGPPLVLVHGLLGDHTRWNSLRPFLEPHFTVHAIDRRGRGASGDATDYAFEREGEDVAAVVDAVTQVTGTPVDVLGSSGGALYALDAATQTSSIRRMALFEPPPTNFAHLLPSGFLERLEELLAEDDREGILVEAYRTIVGLSNEEIDQLRSRPAWPNRIAAAHTVPRELRLPPDKRYFAEQMKSITAAALVLVGGDTPQPYKVSADTVASTLPNAELVVLEGQGHGAEMFAPEVVAERLLAYLHRPS